MITYQQIVNDLHLLGHYGLGKPFSPLSIVYGLALGAVFSHFGRTNKKLILLGILATALAAYNIVVETAVVTVIFGLVESDTRGEAFNRAWHVFGVQMLVCIFVYPHLYFLFFIGAAIWFGRLGAGMYLSIEDKTALLTPEQIANKYPQYARSLWRDPQRVASLEQREYVYQRDGGRCRICGTPDGIGVEMQYDHIVPWSKGGMTTVDNLQLLCEPCNKSKSDKTMNEFL